ncbi:hypothetical protein PILCRDRAFT_14803 [Piloderma croceum F 1598]|uniref:Uncharacterized protein n=1 Tax=Piloderma croceum (strain F 1598) TaxID=765440 RepID=A0A0C3F1E5_PILCF|nr:hypothetical protein PILCRDRAFT_14803 [Piloderma croceum F 1598]
MDEDITTGPEVQQQPELRIAPTPPGLFSACDDDSMMSLRRTIADNEIDNVGSSFPDPPLCLPTQLLPPPFAR